MSGLSDRSDRAQLDDGETKMAPSKRTSQICKHSYACPLGHRALLWLSSATRHGQPALFSENCAMTEKSYEQNRERTRIVRLTLHGFLHAQYTQLRRPR